MFIQLHPTIRFDEPATGPDKGKVKMEASESDKLDPLWQDLDW